MSQVIAKPMGRHGPTMPWGLLVLVFGGAAVVAALHGPTNVSAWMAPSPVPWRTDFESARQEAQSKDKPLLVDFSTTWCRPCQIMAQTTWADPAAARALDDYVPVAADLDDQPDIAMKYGIVVVPTLLVVDPTTGQVIKRAEGVLDTQSLVEWLASKP
ncbi:MAG: thioredoxin family protein [Tepidisphaeraceae bacterium]|jgi:protein disulfide-isomerase